MPTNSNAAALPMFMAVATIRDDTNLAELARLRADEQKALDLLHSAGRIGAHHVSPARRAVFVEVMATDEKHAVETLETLPFADFFDVEIYPISSPEAADAALGVRR